MASTILVTQLNTVAVVKPGVHFSIEERDEIRRVFGLTGFPPEADAHGFMRFIDNHKGIWFDASEIEYIDTVGLGILEMLQALHKDHGRGFWVEQCNPKLWRILELMGRLSLIHPNNQ